MCQFLTIFSIVQVIGKQFFDRISYNDLSTSICFYLSLLSLKKIAIKRS